ncbi:hypothetical protein CGA22_20450 [Pseudomonas sp. PSB18]|nr:hypothetical protein [Pseudomonas sp. PSB18]
MEYVWSRRATDIGVRTLFLISLESTWRGSLLPLECEALTKGAAAYPSGIKLSCHKGLYPTH